MGWAWLQTHTVPKAAWSYTALVPSLFPTDLHFCSAFIGCHKSWLWRRNILEMLKQIILLYFDSTLRHQVNKMHQICYFFFWASFCWPLHFVCFSLLFKHISPSYRAASPLKPQHNETAKELGETLSLLLSAANRAGMLEKVAVTVQCINHRDNIVSLPFAQIPYITMTQCRSPSGD